MRRPRRARMEWVKSPPGHGLALPLAERLLDDPELRVRFSTAARLARALLTQELKVEKLR